MSVVYITQTKLIVKLEKAGLPCSAPKIRDWTKEGMPEHRIGKNGHPKYIWEEVYNWLTNSDQEER
jgi:hypothetical protein